MDGMYGWCCVAGGRISRRARRHSSISERGLLGAAGHRPRVLRGAAALRSATLGSAALRGTAALLTAPGALAATLRGGRLAGPRVVAAPAEPPAATAAGHPGDLGRGVLQAGADLVDVELHDGA